MDIYRQLRLFLDDAEHGLPIEPLNLEAYFSNAQKWIEYRMADENYRIEIDAWERDHPVPTPPVAPRAPTVPRVSIEQVLGPRRRRRDIADLYGNTATVNGQPVRFPEPRLANVEYRLDRVYARAGVFKQITDALEAHQAWRYQASTYLGGVQGAPRVPGAAPRAGPHCGTDEGAASEAAGVERCGLPFDAQFPHPEQSQLP